jgi:hypothetical protein
MLEIARKCAPAPSLSSLPDSSSNTFPPASKPPLFSPKIPGGSYR